MTMLSGVAEQSDQLEQVGRDLTEVYWRPGNTEPFLGLVQRLTGAPLSADAWVAQLQRPLEERCKPVADQPWDRTFQPCPHPRAYRQAHLSESARLSGRKQPGGGARWQPVCAQDMQCCVVVSEMKLP